VDPPTVTVARATAPPRGPLHESVKSRVRSSAGVRAYPLVGLLLDHAPDAVQEVAFVLVHVSFELSPGPTLVGLAVNETVGAGPSPSPDPSSSPQPANAMARVNGASIRAPRITTCLLLITGNERHRGS